LVDDNAVEEIFALADLQDVLDFAEEMKKSSVGEFTVNWNTTHMNHTSMPNYRGFFSFSNEEFSSLSESIRPSISLCSESTKPQWIVQPSNSWSVPLINSKPGSDHSMEDQLDGSTEITSSKST
jgi:hypothetical protein